MKSMLRTRNWWLLLVTPLFIQGVCNKDEDDEPTVPNADQYVTWQIPGHNGNLSMPTDTLMGVRMGNTTAVYGSNRVNTKQFEVEFAGPEAPGSYQTSHFMVLVDGRYYVQASTPVQVNVTNYGSSGQYIIGTYSGTVKDSTSSSNMAVSGQFRIKN